MLGYLFIVIAVLGTSVKGYVGKHTSAFTETPAAAVGFSTVRMLLVFVVGAAVVLAEGDLASITLDSRTLFLSAVSGIANSLLVVSWLFCVRSGAYMMVDAVQTAAIILLPTLTGAFFFSELPQINDWIGIVLVIGGAVVMCSYSGKVKGKITPLSAFLLLLCALSAGTVSLSQKLFNQLCEGQRASVFNLGSYLFSFLSLAIVYLAVFLPQKKKEAPQEKREKGYTGRLLFFAFCMAVCMFIYMFFSTLAAGELPAAKTYPVMQGLTALGAMGMSAVFFKEKLTLSCIIGVGMNFAALMIINLL